MYLKKLDIILRTCDRELRAVERIAPKKEIIRRCVQSLLNSIKQAKGISIKLHIVDDNSKEPLKKLADKFYPLEKTGNAESLKFCYELALKEGKELIYFVEDDWLHFPEAISEMIKDFQTFQSKLPNSPVAIHPYDDPDRYDRDGSKLLSRIVRGAKRHYRTNEYSTQVFLIHKEAFAQFWTIWMESIDEKKKEIHEANITNQIWRKSCILFSPIPSLAIHMNGNNPELYQDWRKIWENSQ